MIDLHYWPTPNGQKISIALEELGAPYRVIPVNIGRGDQFKPEFLAISPNNRMPAIVDHAPADGGEPVALFESGAILLYLAEKTGALLPQAPRRRLEAMTWLFWQVGGVGPMFGQANHFVKYAKERIPYAIDRYLTESNRLLRVLDGQLAERAAIAGDYSIADIATYPWVVSARDYLEIDLAAYPAVARWVATLAERPAVQRGMAVGAELRQGALDEEARKHLFGARPS